MPGLTSRKKLGRHEYEGGGEVGGVGVASRPLI